MRLNKNLSTFVLNTAVIMQDYILFTALCKLSIFALVPTHSSKLKDSGPLSAHQRNAIEWRFAGRSMVVQK